jgi:sugar/nucleoside kinase (ribokinase family)
MEKVKEKFHVYGMGNALVDYEYVIGDEFLTEFNLKKSSMTLIDEKLRATLFESLSNFKKRQGGGSAANTLIALSQLGAKTCYSCKVAADEDGEFYLQDLEAQGVAHHQQQLVSRIDGVTGTCVVLVSEDAERTMCTYLGVTASYGISEVHWDFLKKSEYLYIEGYLFCSDTGTKAVMDAISFARKNGIKIVLTCSDAGVVEAFRSRFDACLAEKIDLIFCNEAESLSISKTQNVEQALNYLKQKASLVVITRSEKGALVWDGKESLEVSGRKVVSKDANGAGDMFAGAFIYGLTQNFSLRKSTELACHCASEVIQIFGPRLEASTMNSILKCYK